MAAKPSNKERPRNGPNSHSEPRNIDINGVDGQPRATLATPSGRGSIATLLLSGEGITQLISRRFRTASGRPISAAPIVQFGHWNHAAELGKNTMDDEVQAWEEVVLTAINAGPGARRQSVVEIQCHGGDRAARSILDSLQSLGFEVVPWVEWSTWVSSIFDGELNQALAAATTHRTALLLLAQRRSANSSDGKGALDREIDQLVDLISRDDTGRAAAHTRLCHLIDLASVGLHLVAPWQVAVVGPPNVGKSSLVNALVGYQRAIVFDQPGTTRDELESVTALDGWPVQLWDTAGLRSATDEIESQGISRVAFRLNAADLIIHVCDARMDGQQPSQQSSEATDVFVKIRQHHNVLVARNKIDLVPEAELPTAVNSIGTSAVTGTGLEMLRRRIIRALIPTPPQSDAPLLFTRRQVALARQALAALDSQDWEQARASLISIMD